MAVKTNFKEFKYSKYSNKIKQKILIANSQFKDEIDANKYQYQKNILYRRYR